MNKGKWKLSLNGALLILSLCILIAAGMVSSAIRESSSSITDEAYEGELMRFNDNLSELIQILQENNNADQ